MATHSGIEIWPPGAHLVVTATAALFDRCVGCERINIPETVLLVPMAVTTRMWRSVDAFVRTSESSLSTQADQVTLCRRFFKSGSEQCAATFTAARQGRNSVPLHEGLSKNKLRAFIAKRWPGAHGLLQISLPASSSMCTIHVEWAAPQLGEEIWCAEHVPAAVGRRSKAAPAGSCSIAVAAKLCLDIAEHIAGTSGAELIRLSVVFQHSSSSAVWLLACTGIECKSSGTPSNNSVLQAVVKLKAKAKLPLNYRVYDAPELLELPSVVTNRRKSIDKRQPLPDIGDTLFPRISGQTFGGCNQTGCRRLAHDDSGLCFPHRHLENLRHGKQDGETPAWRRNNPDPFGLNNV